VSLRQGLIILLDSGEVMADKDGGEAFIAYRCRSDETRRDETRRGAALLEGAKARGKAARDDENALRKTEWMPEMWRGILRHLKASLSPFLSACT